MSDSAEQSQGELQVSGELKEGERTSNEKYWLSTLVRYLDARAGLGASQGFLI